MIYHLDNLKVLYLDELIDHIQKYNLPFFEYSFLPVNDLKKSFRSQLIKLIEKNNNLNKLIISKNRICGLLTIEKDEFDSQIFNFNAYRVTNALILTEKADEKIEVLDRMIKIIEELSLYQNINYLVISLNTNNNDTNLLFNKLIANGFYFLNTLITFSQISNKNLTTNIEQKSIQSNPDFKVRPCEVNDLDEIVEIARTSYKINRLHLDPNLDSQKCDLLYAESAKNSILNKFADIIFVAVYAEKIIGYYSARKRNIPETDFIYGEAIISAIKSEYRGKGVFSLLNFHLLNWFNKHTQFSEMGTYIINTPVHKTWVNLGLPIIRGTYQLARFIK
jgi:hypothetical protein